MNNLSPIGEAIRHYKLNASGGYAEWSRVPCTDDYRMHVPAMDFDVSGTAEIKEVNFGWLKKIRAKQESVDIVEWELQSLVTCIYPIKMEIF